MTSDLACPRIRSLMILSDGPRSKWFKSQNFAHVFRQTRPDQLTNFISGVAYGPTVEVLRLLIKAGKDLGKKGFVLRVAIDSSAVVDIRKRNKIGDITIVPYVAILFDYTATTFRKAGVANFPVIFQDFSCRRACSLRDRCANTLS